MIATLSCSLFRICSGVRQGAVLLPLLFALLIRDIGQFCDLGNCCFVILCANHIILLTSSVNCYAIKFVICV